jgi:hypothetical protein
MRHNFVRISDYNIYSNNFDPEIALLFFRGPGYSAFVGRIPVLPLFFLFAAELHFIDGGLNSVTRRHDLHRANELS